MLDRDELFGTAEAAAYLGVSPATIRRHVYEVRDLVPDKVLERALVFRRSTLDRYRAARRPPGRPRQGEARKEEEGMARVVLVTDGSAFEMFDLQGWYYDDNGAEPDGNSWLPNAVGLDQETMQDIVAAGMGNFVDVRFVREQALMDTATYDEAGRLVDDTTGQATEPEDSYIERLQAELDEMAAHWAHYGAYGTIDSFFVYVPR